MKGSWSGAGVVVADGLEECMAREGLGDFEAVMSLRDVEVVKDRLASRQVHRMRLSDGGVVYLKRYFRVPFGDALRDRLFGRGYDSSAGREWVALKALEALEVPAPVPLVYGEERRAGLVRRAFLVTRGIELGPTLEELAYSTDLTPRRRRGLCAQLGRLLRRLHASGLNHRDFYLGHLALGADEESRESIHVLDLNRADLRANVGMRWRVKDLAALHFSAPARLVSRRDRLRVLHYYAGGSLRELRDLIAAVESKAERMRGHARRQVARGAPNIHVNE